MLVETKAKVGVFSIALGAYLPQFPTLVPEFEAQYEAFKKTIPDTVELVDGGIVTTKELSMKAGDKFRAADVDLVILQLLTYATSYNMLPAIRDLNVPVVLVKLSCIAIWESGRLVVSSCRRASAIFCSWIYNVMVFPVLFLNSRPRYDRSICKMSAIWAGVIFSYRFS